MPSRMAMVGIVTLLVCTLVALQPAAANVWWTGEVAFANEEDGNNNMKKQQQHEYTGYQPRLASFIKASDQANSEKDKCPLGQIPSIIRNRHHHHIDMKEA